MFVACAFALTLTLDVYQRKLASPGKEPIIFESMWAPGEPMQKAYAEIFADFERENPQYKVEPRWDGRWAISAIRPRFLTHSDIPDMLNTDRDSLAIIVGEGYAEPLDDILEQQPHPDDAGKSLREAYQPQLLKKCFYEPRSDENFKSGTYMLPGGVWTTLIFFNRVHYEALKLEIPKTWSAFLENCRRLKAAGYVPIAADQDAYGAMWANALLRRAMSESLLRSSVEGHGPRFDADPRFRAVFQAVRDLQQPGWFMDGWEGSQWPAAQRRWCNGEATHMICGSWLIRETLEYHPEATKFRLGGFVVPTLDTVDWGAQTPEPPGDPTGVDAGVVGDAILKGGKNRAGAIKLLAFLAKRKSAGVLAHVGKEIPSVFGAPFPTELEEIRQEYQNAKTIYREGFSNYAPKWNKFIWNDLHHRFFMIEAKTLSVEGFLKELQEKTDAYHKDGGEAGIR